MHVRFTACPYWYTRTHKCYIHLHVWSKFVKREVDWITNTVNIKSCPLNEDTVQR
jgi:hypothetical protein